MTAPNIELGDGESLLVDSDETIYRQITKHLLAPDGSIATHAYVDSEEPSYAQSRVVSAQASRESHARLSRSPSLQVRGLTVGEVIGAGRYVVDDTGAPLEEGEPRAPGHCYINARGLDKLTLKTLRAKLWKAANDRGEIPTTDPVESEPQLDLDGS